MKIRVSKKVLCFYVLWCLNNENCYLINVNKLSILTYKRLKTALGLRLKDKRMGLDRIELYNCKSLKTALKQLHEL